MPVAETLEEIVSDLLGMLLDEARIVVVDVFDTDTLPETEFVEELEIRGL